MANTKELNNTKTNVSYVAPFLTMVFLFFVVGFLTTANTQFQGPLKETFLADAGSLKNTFATLITFSWFLAYPLSGGIGSRWIDRKGYRTTLVRSLAVMFAGLGLVFLSSWMTVNYPALTFSIGNMVIPFGFVVFLLGSFVTGASVTILQVVVNPYLSACHVERTQPIQRLAMGGSANSIGTMLAPYFVSLIVFGGVAIDDISVDSIMAPFLVMMAVVAVLAVTLSRLRLPDIQSTRASGAETLDRSVWSFSNFRYGVIAIFFYVGAEVCIGANINMYATEKGFTDPALLATLYWGGLLIGRLVGSTLSTVSPRTQLLVTTIAATVLTVLSVVFDSPALLVAVGLCHSIMWGAIYTLSVAGLGKYTAVASGVFMIGVVGGAILPLMQGLLADFTGGWRGTWMLVAACEIVMLTYALKGSKVKDKESVNT